MRKFIIYIISLLGTLVLADCTQSESKATVTDQYVINTQVPAHLQGATYTITQADGKSSTARAEDFKLVPRKQQFITKATTKNIETFCQDDRKFRVSILAGKGVQEGIRTGNPSPGVAEAESKVGFVGGAQVQYRFLGPLSIGFQGQTNKTGLGVLGLDF